MTFDGICHLLSPTPCPNFCHYAAFIQSVRPRFLVGGDWNAKHTSGARALSRLKDAFSSLLFVDATVPTSDWRTDLLADESAQDTRLVGLLCRPECGV